MSAKNEKGNIFGRLKVISQQDSQLCKNGTMAMWKCRCACGKIKVVRGTSLRAGVSKSCGCLNREITTARLVRLNFIHGKTGTPEYHAYQHAKRRCTAPKDVSWLNYGGRGIAFRFKSFLHFLKHLGPRPTPKHSLDRIQNNGHYEIGNVKWSTKKEQMSNRRAYATSKRICCADCGSTKFKRLSE